MSLRQIESFRSKRELVYETLRQEIVEGRLAPGERLIIDELAGKLGVSQIPVREALQQLQADGYVVIQPYLGAKVSELHTDSVAEVFTLLEALEVITSRAACLHMADDDLAEVERIVQSMDTLLEQPGEWSRANKRLHQTICDHSGTLLAGRLIGKVLDHWDRLRRHYPADLSLRRRSKAQADHWRILEALRSRDPDRVEGLVRRHNRDALEAYIAHT